MISRKLISALFFTQLLILIIFMSNAFANKFKVVFHAYPWTLNDTSGWCNSIKNYWGATGVQLNIPWITIEKKKGFYDFSTVKSAIDTVLNNSLDISIRVRMGGLLPDWLYPDSAGFGKNDFHIDHKGNVIPPRYLNLTSHNSKVTLENHYKVVIDTICKYLNMKGYSKSVEFIPSVDQVGEMEFTSEWEHVISSESISSMTGYSSHEISAFQDFLKDKYTTISKLKETWKITGSESVINNWDDIDPKNYDWHVKSNKSSDFYETNPRLDKFDYPQGRIDWLSFKFKELESMINDFSDITDDHSIGVNTCKMGVQLGSIHDFHLDYRGFLDPTSFLEKTSALRVADIIGYPFDFGADYARSICRYWKWKDGNQRYFSSETNFPLFGYKGSWGDIDQISTYVSDTLAPSWNNQVDTYRRKGADQQLIFGWGNNQGYYTIKGIRVNWTDFVSRTSLVNKLGTTDGDLLWSSYKSYRNLLRTLKKKDVVDDSAYTRAVHLSSAYYVYAEGVEKRNNKFPMLDAVEPKDEYRYKTLSYTNYDCDILTDYMINNMIKGNDCYLFKYSDGISLTASSKYMADDIYLAFMNKCIAGLIITNATSHITLPKYLTNAGSKDEYGESRSPIHLIWRTRTDLQSRYPDANRDSQSSDPREDIIDWAENYGINEYPDWKIKKIYEGDSCYAYDIDLYTLWCQKDYLRNYFTDGHNSWNPKFNYIDWAIQYGNSYIELSGKSYDKWPYIGPIVSLSNRNISQSKINSKISFSYKIKQNYPNPFNSITRIKYQLPKGTKVSIIIFNIQGKKVTSLVNEYKKKGHYSVLWDASKYSSGVYFYKIIAGPYIKTKKMLLLK